MLEKDLSEGPELLRLTSDQVTRHWEDVKETVSYTLPPTEQPTDLGFTSLLETICDGDAQVWVPVEDGNTRGIIVTLFTEEAVFRTRNLLVLSAFAYSTISDALWRETYRVIRKFAKASNCRFITGYTTVPRVEEVVNMLGGDTRWKFIRLEVS